LQKMLRELESQSFVVLYSLSALLNVPLLGM